VVRELQDHHIDFFFLLLLSYRKIARALQRKNIAKTCMAAKKQPRKKIRRLMCVFTEFFFVGNSFLPEDIRKSGYHEIL
jgi:hypothetical protein